MPPREVNTSRAIGLGRRADHVSKAARAVRSAVARTTFGRIPGSTRDNDAALDEELDIYDSSFNLTGTLVARPFTFARSQASAAMAVSWKPTPVRSQMVI